MSSPQSTTTSPYCPNSWCEAHLSAGEHSANCPNLDAAAPAKPAAGTTWAPRGLNKKVPAQHAEGDQVRVGASREVYTVHAVEWVERGTSRFDFYRVANAAGEVLPARYTRVDLHTV